MGLLEQIRTFVIEKHFKPAMSKGEKTITLVSGVIHRQMGLEDRMPAVCNALRSKDPWGFPVTFVKEERAPTVKKDSSTNEYIFTINKSQ
ncbi:MAG: hypothetical protein NWF04_04535 [Candidatus Bathyarchaeota archaeon]|nr:hypothetical protein [Candidatus Bathyarchaeota archaeon]